MIDDLDVQMSYQRQLQVAKNRLARKHANSDYYKINERSLLVLYNKYTVVTWIDRYKISDYDLKY